jgi:hypothetical protein
MLVALSNCRTERVSKFCPLHLAVCSQLNDPNITHTGDESWAATISVEDATFTQTQDIQTRSKKKKDIVHKELLHQYRL